MNDNLDERFDAVVIGGGAAGLSGALTLARARRRVVVVDAGRPRNAPAHGVHALLGMDGISPAELLERGRADVTRYGGLIIDGTVAAVTRDGDDFAIALDDGRRLTARRVLLATGLVDELPDVPGLRERWGRDVVHCPYCHGFEVRDEAIGVIASGPMSVHQALLFRQWSHDVVFFAGTDDPSPEDAERLAARGVPVVAGRVVGLDVEDDAIVGVRTEDGATHHRSVVVTATRMVARVPFMEGSGLTPVAHPSGMGEHVPADAVGRTDVPGVWVAGNVTDMSAQVAPAMAQGLTAGAQINADLVTEETERAVAERRSGH